MSDPFDLTAGFRRSADSPDLFKTTHNAKSIERDAFNFGMGDAKGLESSGLIALSNAAVTLLDSLKNRKERDKRFEDLVFEEIRKSLEDIHAEIEWLDEQIKTEEKAIQSNNTEIDFIRTLNEDNILDANGEVREDVQALLKKHGYKNVEDMDVADVLLLTQAIETDLHSDNIERKERIGNFQTRIGDLQNSVKRFQTDMPDGTPQDIQDKATAIANREPYDVSYFAMKESYADNKLVADALNKVENNSNFAVETSTFDFGKPT